MQQSSRPFSTRPLPLHRRRTPSAPHENWKTRRRMAVLYSSCLYRVTRLTINPKYLEIKEMIKPQELAVYFEASFIATFGARCPICKMGSLRIYACADETKFRCLNGCNRGKILGRVGLTLRDLRPPEKPSGLTAGLTPQANTCPVQVASPEPKSLTPEAQAADGGAQ